MARYGRLLIAAERLLLTLWLGALWAIGYLAVPILFSSLDDRILAGMLAGRMFTAVSLLGLGCGGALLLIWWRQQALALREPRIWLLLSMLLLVVVGEFVLQPQMAALKAAGLVVGSETAARFGMLHGIASLLYLLNSLIGVALLLLKPRAEALRAG